MDDDETRLQKQFERLKHHYGLEYDLLASRRAVRILCERPGSESRCS